MANSVWVGLDQGGAFQAATVDTGQGANELYDMDQNVLTTSSPTFAGVTAGTFTATSPATYIVTNGLTDRAYDADTVLVAELADVVGTLIADLRALGLVL